MVVGRRRKTSSPLLYTVMARALIFNGHFRFPLLFLECERGCKGVFVVFPGQGHRNSVKHDMRKEENFIFISRLIWDVFFLLLTPPLRFTHLSDFFAQTFLSRERKRKGERKIWPPPHEGVSRKYYHASKKKPSTQDVFPHKRKKDIKKCYSGNRCKPGYYFRALNPFLLLRAIVGKDGGLVGW